MLNQNGNSRQIGGLDEVLFREFRSAVYSHSGIHFEDNKQYLLESRLAQRMQALGLHSFEAYRNLLFSRNGTAELHALINAVTINETFFFRHPTHLDLLEKQILPQLARARAASVSPRIRIWSAACSSGDEPYSIALLIRDRIQPLYPRIVFEVVGTDIDSTILAAAKQATYAPYAVRNIPAPLLAKYFDRQGDRYVLDPGVRNLVRFKQLNLNDKGAMTSMRGFDVIVCANVLIYFDADAKKRTLQALHSALNPDGYLFIGFSETLFGTADSFVAERIDKTLVYRRADRLTNGVPQPTPERAGYSNDTTPVTR